MKFLKKLLFIYLVVLITQGAEAGYKEDMFFEANKHYSEGSYKEAAGIYEELISRGIKSGNLYYNLGNAYYKMGEKGRSLLNYERARRLMPQDEDVLANAAFVKTVLDVKQPEEEYLWYEKIFIAIRDMFSPGIWFVNSLVMFYLICIFIGISIFKITFRRTAYIISSIVGILFIANLFFFGKSYNITKRMQKGIIVAPKTEVRYSPSYSGAVAFELTEGIQASIIRHEGQWTHIRLNRKNSGWVESEAIEKI